MFVQKLNVCGSLLLVTLLFFGVLTGGCGQVICDISAHQKAKDACSTCCRNHQYDDGKVTEQEACKCLDRNTEFSASNDSICREAYRDRYWMLAQECDRTQY